MKPRVTTRTYAKSLARSGPEIQPNQIRLADEAQTEKDKVFTQSDVNQGMSGGGGADLTGYAKTNYVNSADNALNDLLATETQSRKDGDTAASYQLQQAEKGLEAKIEANTQAIEALEELVQALEARGKTAIHRFDTRLATTTQGGAETGPSYMRMNKEDLDGNPVDLAEWESAQFIFTYNGQDENVERPILDRDLIEGNSEFGRITFDLPWIDALHDPTPKCVMTLILK